MYNLVNIIDLQLPKVELKAVTNYMMDKGFKRFDLLPNGCRKFYKE